MCRSKSSESSCQIPHLGGKINVSLKLLTSAQGRKHMLRHGMSFILFHEASPTLSKQNEEWLFIGLFIRSGKLGLYIHEASFLSRPWKQMIERASWNHRPLSRIQLKKKINLNSYPKSLLTVLKGEVSSPLCYFKTKSSVNPGWQKTKMRNWRVVHIRPADKNTPMKTLGIKPYLTSQNFY